MLKLLPLTMLLAAGLAQAGSRVEQARADSYLTLVSELFQDERVYIVQLEEPPALAYRGGKSGLAATRPSAGEGFDSANPRVQRYGRYLTDKHDAALQAVGAYQQKIYSYRYAFNGFAARMTPVQAQKLRARRGVLRVWEDQIRYLSTNDSPRFLGLLDAQQGLRVGRGLKGEDVVIGVIDSGIAPEHPSFKDRIAPQKPKLCRTPFGETTLLGIWLCTKFRRKEERLTYQPPANWNGACEAGDTDVDRFEVTDCNNKVIGARFYVDGFLERHLLDIDEFLSPRDADGHGTHIASTAAGNEVRAVIGGEPVARISGMAPRARIAVYKACWLEPGQTRGSCSTADLQRAIEDAVADGVDIINYSVGSSDISISDPDDLALLAASDAGVLSVVAAGNDGPAPGSILSPAAAPWVLSVGASTRAGRKYDRALRVDNPASLEGNYIFREATFTPPLRDEGIVDGELALVDDGVVAIDGSEVGTTYDACEDIENTGDIDGKIAFLQRGICTFDEKLLNVANAGAIGAVVFNNEGGLIDMSGTRDAVDIPAVMISQADGQRLLDELTRDEVVEVQLLPDLVIEQDATGDRLASQSARGPNLGAPDILKPDVTAPGVEILAGQTPDVANGIRGELYQYLTGTSMSVPHVAGVAALLREQHPGWSPAALRSALMTTARQDVLLDDGTTPAGPFDIGAGHIVPNRAVDPGLVYDAGKDDYNAFNCGSDIPRVSPAECDALITAGYSTDPSDLNLPSIALADLPGRRTLSRQVTNVSDALARFEASVDAPEGIAITVQPDVLDLAAGETATYKVEFATNGALLNEWRFGSLTWSDGIHQVRSPIAVRPVGFAAPLAVAGSGTEGSLRFDVEFGYDGDYAAQATGFLRAEVATCTDLSGAITDCSVADDPADNYVFEPSTALLPLSVQRFRFDTVTDTVFLRVALYNDDTDGDDDLDLYVYFSSGDGFFEFVGASTNENSNEFVEVEFPRAGEYFVDVHGFDTDPVNGSGAIFDLSVWRLASGDARSNLTLSAPTQAIAGTTAPITVQWQNLGSGRYLGGVEHADDGGRLEPFTSIDVFVPEPDPAP
jgi:subtilisin family serine protease